MPTRLVNNSTTRFIELVNTKGGKPRTVPVNKDLRKALRAYRSECKNTGDADHVFLARTAKPGTPLTAKAVAAWFRDLYTRRLGWSGTPRTLVAAHSRPRPQGRRRWPAARFATSRTCSATPV